LPTFHPLSEVIAQLEAGLPPSPEAGFLGADLDLAEASLVLLPVPWEATTSYGGGTSAAPEAIISASHQLDLEDSFVDRPYRAGIACLPPDTQIKSANASARNDALKVIAALERGETEDAALQRVNSASAEVNDIVYQSAREQLTAGRLVGLIGGDHSSPLGLIRALAESVEPFAILHFDAHQDLRLDYEGFTGSHASIFRNVMESVPTISKLVQVGIRDYSREEKAYAEQLGERCQIFYAAQLFRMQAEGISFATITETIIEQLPERVYISFDIDALDPPYCPSTGTPVPGGLSFAEACYILDQLGASGRTIVGFDLCEVTPGADGDEWDANVGARLLYKLCGTLLHSHKLCQGICK
jgi:agmatinase